MAVSDHPECVRTNFSVKLVFVFRANRNWTLVETKYYHHFSCATRQVLSESISYGKDGFWRPLLAEMSNLPTSQGLFRRLYCGQWRNVCAMGDHHNRRKCNTNKKTFELYLSFRCSFIGVDISNGFNRTSRRRRAV